MLTSKKVKEVAKKSGADIVGIASMDRFEGLPKEMDPRQIFPEAKSMIVLGFRILRGCLRGIEEGTWFTAFSFMGYGGIRWVFQPICLWKFTKIIENEGYENALPELKRILARLERKTKPNSNHITEPRRLVNDRILIEALKEAIGNLED